MKKIVLFVLVLSFVICVVSCGNNSQQSTTGGGVIIISTTTSQIATTVNTAAQTTAPTYIEYTEPPVKFDIFQILSDFDTSVIYGKMSEEDKAEFKAACAAVSMGVSFYDNGEMRIIDIDGTVYIQFADGTWTTTVSGQTLTTTQTGVIIYSKLGEADRQALIEKYAKEGTTVEFLADGETRFTDKDGNIRVQMDNGLWYYPGGK